MNTPTALLGVTTAPSKRLSPGQSDRSSELRNHGTAADGPRGLIMLTNGAWFTVNNTFLRITHSTGYTTDYLYAVSSDGTFYHNSYQAYERADFRMFSLKANSETFPASCGSHCSSEIPKGEGPSLYANMDNGHSTFVPAPCPTSGCE